MIGKYVLYVKRDGSESWGELRRMNFTDGTKENILVQLKAVRDRWFTNYVPYRTAAFKIEEK